MTEQSRFPDTARRMQSGPPGIAMILTLLLVGLLFVMALSLVSLSSSDYQASTNGSLSIQALYNADAGLEEAKLRLSPSTVAPQAAAGVNVPTNPVIGWRAYIYSGSIAAPTTAQMQSAVQVLDPTYGKKIWNTSETESTAAYDFYNTVQVSSKINWGWARIRNKLDTSDPLNPRIIYWNVVNPGETTAATSTGTVNGIPGTFNNLPVLIVTSEGIQGRVRRMIEMQINPSPAVTSPFGNGAFGRTGVALNGGPSTDSYDSSLGAYGGTNVGSEGDVITNATGSNVIYVGPGGTVQGTARIGVGGDTGTSIDNKGTISGGGQVLTANVSLSAVTIPTAGVVNLGNIASNLAKRNNSNTTNASDPCNKATLILSAGTYRLSSLSISGNGSLCVTGRVTLYVDGNIDAGGNGIVNASGVPTNLMIFGTNNCTDVKIHGNGNFYGGIYAPNAAVEVVGSPSSQLFGAVTGNFVTLTGNGSFHYDKALSNLGGSASVQEYVRYSWREIPF